MNKRDNKGITLIALITTVILLLILAGVGISNGIKTYENSTVQQFIFQMKLIQAKVDSMEISEWESIKTTRENIMQQELEYIIEKLASENIEIDQNDLKQENWILFNKENLKTELGFDEIDKIILDEDNNKNVIAINYKTKKVFSFVGVQQKGNKYYTQYKLPGGQQLIAREDVAKKQLYFEFSKSNSNNETENLEYLLNGLNAIVKLTNISLDGKDTEEYSIKYKLVDSNKSYIYLSNMEQSPENIDHNSTYEAFNNDTKDTWKNVNNNMVNITRTGMYAFVISNKAQDNVYTRLINITIGNSPKLKQGMEKTDSTDEHNLLNTIDWYYSYDTSQINNGPWVSYNEEYYLWIPRFAYRIKDLNNNSTYEFKFIKGNSNSSTDNEDIVTKENGWIIPSFFNDSSTNQEYTGIWLKNKEYNTISSIITYVDLVTLTDEQKEELEFIQEI